MGLGITVVPGEAQTQKKGDRKNTRCLVIGVPEKGAKDKNYLTK